MNAPIAKNIIALFFQYIAGTIIYSGFHCFLLIKRLMGYARNVKPIEMKADLGQNL